MKHKTIPLIALGLLGSLASAEQTDNVIDVESSTPVVQSPEKTIFENVLDFTVDSFNYITQPIRWAGSELQCIGEETPVIGPIFSTVGFGVRTLDYVVNRAVWYSTDTLKCAYMVTDDPHKAWGSFVNGTADTMCLFVTSGTSFAVYGISNMTNMLIDGPQDLITIDLEKNPPYQNAIIIHSNEKPVYCNPSSVLKIEKEKE